MSKLLENLNEEQESAVTFGEGPLLIVAGAGTGKTTVITRRIAYLILDKKQTADSILALTFTEKAAEEMLSRVEQLLPIGFLDLWISTFHSFCQRILESHGMEIGLPGEFKIFDTTKQWLLIYKNLENFELDYYRPLGNPKKFISAMLSHFSRLKDEGISPDEYESFAQNLELNQDSTELIKADNIQQITEIRKIKELAGAYRTYQQLLLDNQALDFADLISYTYKLFKERPNVLDIYRKKFKHIMVDEFQDTNLAQFDLIRLLAPEEKKANLCVVGDDDQSIYKFRGASVSNILKFKEFYSYASQITLVKNYRSNQAILDLAYNFIQTNNPDRLETKLGINKQLISANDSFGEIEVIAKEDLSEELSAVVGKILKIKRAYPKSSWNDFAILLRANSAATELLPKLEAAGIPFNYLANRGLYRKPVIADILAFFQLLDNYHESSAFYRIMRLPKFIVNQEDFVIFSNFAHKHTLSLFEAAKRCREITALSSEAQSSIELLISTIERRSASILTGTALENFVHILSELGLLTTLTEEKFENLENRDLIDQFYKKIEAFEQDSDDKSLRAFMIDLRLEIEAGDLGIIPFLAESGPESLKVMTIHAAKGLEFENVFVINMVDQRFPTRGKPESIAIPDPLIREIQAEGDFHLQEERRLFYVAITRAKKRIYFSWSKNYGGTRLKKPSRFLVEANLLPGNLLLESTGKVVFNDKNTNVPLEYALPMPKSFSFSDLMTFENCPLEYKLRRLIKLPLPGTAALSFGSTVHLTLQKLVQNYINQSQIKQTGLFPGRETENFAPDWKLARELYEQSWVDEWFPSKSNKEQFRKLGLEMVKIVLDDLIANRPKIRNVEEYFKLPLENYWFVGKVDRIDVFTGGAVIIDYKTGNSVKSSTSDLDQLRVYQWAASELFQLKVDKLYYWYLKDNTRTVEILASPEEIEKLKQKLLDKIEKIIQCIQSDSFDGLHKQLKDHNCVVKDFVL